MSRQQILSKSKGSKGYFIDAVVAIVNIITMRRTTISMRFMLDTGFTGGIHVPSFHVADARMIGVEPRHTILELGGEKEKPVCV